MVKQKKQACLVLGIGLILAAMRTAVITYTMDKNLAESDTYYLPEGNVAVISFLVLSLLFGGFIAWSAISMGKGKRVEMDGKTCVAPAALVVAFLLIGASLVYIFASDAEKAAGGNIQNAVILLSVCSAIAFLFFGLKNTSAEAGKGTLAAISLLPLFMFALRLLSDFIASSATPLASSGGFHILGLSAAMLYFLCEGKSYVSGGSAALCYLFGYLAMFLLLVYGVPNLILHCFSVFEFDYSAAFSAVDIGMVVYICARLSTAKLLPLKEEEAKTENTENIENTEEAVTVEE